MQTVTNYFIANLALADVVIGLFSIPFQFQVSLSKYFFLLISRAAQILGGLIFQTPKSVWPKKVKVYQVSEPCFINKDKGLRGSPDRVNVPGGT